MRPPIRSPNESLAGLKGIAMFRRLSLALALSAAALVPVAANAQVYPYGPGPYGPPPPPPQRWERFDVRGWIAYSRPYFLTLDSQGRQIPVYLHNGTIIRPTGLTLQRGMVIGIDGRWSGSNFVADRIVLLQPPREDWR
jgi:hypothetical protein